MTEQVGTYIGTQVKALRKHRGITQAQLAEASGVPQGNLSRLERGLLQELTVRTLLALAAALRVTPQTLLPAVPPARHRHRLAAVPE